MVKLTDKKQVEEQRRERKRVRDRNYRFRRMSPAQKRVRIAKDVLEQLEVGKIEAFSGRYLRLRGSIHERVWEALHMMTMSDPLLTEEQQTLLDSDISSVIDKSAGGCTACGIGSCFVAATKRADGFPLRKMVMKVGRDSAVADINLDQPMREYLGQWFSQRQLGMIEAAFEVTNCHSEKAGLPMDDRDVQRAVMFGRAIGESRENSRNRLNAIMQNIVDNGGEFRP